MKQTNEFRMEERYRLEKILSEKTGYYLHSLYLLRQAFTRSSYSAEHGGENNEILEFLGDQILSYYVVKLVADRCGGLNSNCEYRFRIRENRFSALKQELVSNEALAGIIDEWGVAEYLIVGKSDFQNEVNRQTKVKADLFEAILGAIAVSCKWDPAILEKVVEKMLSLDERIDRMIRSDYRPVSFDLENAVTVLKELAEHGECSIPKYEYGTPEYLGYDKNGNPVWCCTCSVINERTGIIRQVWSSSKKAVKKCAAYLVLCEHFQLQNEYGSNRVLGGWAYENGKLIPYSESSYQTRFS